MDAKKAEPILAFTNGPERFESFQEILDRTVAFNPTRSEQSLRRGILHNAKELPDGGWSWRWDPVRDRSVGDAAANTEAAPPELTFGSLWDAVSAVACPLLLARGGASQVVGDEDVDELLRRQPDAEVVVVADAGHSIQGDKPTEMAALIRRFLDLG